MSKVKKIVDKVRRIYFIDNVKFHFDRVAGLGTFVEIEAIDSKGSIEIEELKKQCEYYIDYLQLRDADFIAASYSDLI